MDIPVATLLNRHRRRKYERQAIIIYGQIMNFQYMYVYVRRTRSIRIPSKRVCPCHRMAFHKYMMHLDGQSRETIRTFDSQGVVVLDEISLCQHFDQVIRNANSTEENNIIGNFTFKFPINRNRFVPLSF